MANSAPQANLIEVSQMFVDLLYKIFLRKSVGYALVEFSLIAVIV